MDRECIEKCSDDDLRGNRDKQCKEHDPTRKVFGQND